MTLEKILVPIAKDLQRVEGEIKYYLNSDNKFVHQLNAYVRNRAGKMLRPALVLLSAKTGTANLDQAVSVAAAVEIIHTATLIHDDVIDDSDKRRGQPTVNSKWNNAISIVLGDCWCAKAIMILLKTAIAGILEGLLETVNIICAGELQHLNRCYDLLLTEGQYLEIAEKKTASLMSFCCKAGALTAKAPVENSQALAGYGLNLGIAFQIVDDCLDMVGTEQRTGKPSGSDLSGGKVTLPLIYTVNTVGKTDQRWIKKVFEKHQIDQNDASRIRNMAKQCGAIRLCLEKAAEYRDISREALSSLKDCEARDALGRLADHLVEKEFGLRLSSSIT
jgi:octaprenyl-diphosphate synthase